MSNTEVTPKVRIRFTFGPQSQQSLELCEESLAK